MRLGLIHGSSAFGRAFVRPSTQSFGFLGRPLTPILVHGVPKGYSRSYASGEREVPSPPSSSSPTRSNRLERYNEWARNQILKARTWDDLHKSIMTLAGRSGKYRLNLETLALIAARAHKAINHSVAHVSDTSSLTLLMEKLEQSLQAERKQPTSSHQPRMIAALAHSLVTINRVKPVPQKLQLLVEKHTQATMLNMPVPSLVRAIGALGHFGLVRGKIAHQLARLLQLKPVLRELSKNEILHLCEATAFSGCLDKDLWKGFRNAALEEPQEHDAETLRRVSVAFVLGNQRSENIMELVDKEGARFISHLSTAGMADVLRLFTTFGYSSQYFLPSLRKKMKDSNYFSEPTESNAQEFADLVKLGTVLAQNGEHIDSILSWFSNSVVNAPYLLDPNSIGNSLTLSCLYQRPATDVLRKVFEEYCGNIQYLREGTLCKGLWTFAHHELATPHLLDLTVNRLQTLKQSDDLKACVAKLTETSQWYLLFGVLIDCSLGSTDAGRKLHESLTNTDFTELYFSKDNEDITGFSSQLKSSEHYLFDRSPVIAGSIRPLAATTVQSLFPKGSSEDQGCSINISKRVCFLPITTNSVEIASPLHQQRLADFAAEFEDTLLVFLDVDTLRLLRSGGTSIDKLALQSLSTY
eukprot:gb/GECG01001938.1/.p1 GENE.gb/GECG01001938.1/~~gb/GECG01001938.1/.p1  ORF type:complete len:640 (+),score=65.94 gb/GECG01001938.1/:1-1920(+)